MTAALLCCLVLGSGLHQPPRTFTFVLEHYVAGKTILIPRRSNDRDESLFWRSRKLGIVRDQFGTTVDVWIEDTEGPRIRVTYPMFNYIYDE